MAPHAIQIKTAERNERILAVGSQDARVAFIYFIALQETPVFYCLALIHLQDGKSRLRNPAINTPPVEAFAC